MSSPRHASVSPSYTPASSTYAQPEAPSHDLPVHLCPLWEVHPYRLSEIEREVREGLRLGPDAVVTSSYLSRYTAQQMEQYATARQQEPASPPRSPTYSPSAARFPRRYTQEAHPNKLANRARTGA